MMKRTVFTLMFTMLVILFASAEEDGWIVIMPKDNPELWMKKREYNLVSVEVRSQSVEECATWMELNIEAYRSILDRTLAWDDIDEKFCYIVLIPKSQIKPKSKRMALREELRAMIFDDIHSSL